MKTCSTCKESKDLTSFGKLTSAKDGFNHRCKTCMRASGRASIERNPEGYALRKRESWLRRNYSITVTDYDRMVTEQNNSCAICNSQEMGTNRGYWCVDHCHTTGKVRGLLCSSCNKALGQLGDTVEALEKAIAYLALDTH